MYRGIFLCLVLGTLVSCASMQPGGMSADMSKIVASMRTDQYTLDTSRLFYNGDKDEFQYMRRQDAFELYQLPPAPGADAIKYTVYYDRSANQYWVGTTGGVDGVKHLFGPGKYPPGN